MRVIPANNVLIAPNLLHFVYELLLKDGIDRLNGDSRSHLRHREDINDCDCVVIHDLANHQTHDFEWNTSSAMLHHFE